MISNFFIDKIKENFEFVPTNEQNVILTKITEFLFSKEETNVFLLKGYAGTGKSSLVGALVKTMLQFKQKTVLLAPTGRAAKVFSEYADHPAFTIHKKIYRQKRISNEPSTFLPTDNLHTNTLFIVDEASMINNDGLDSFIFGSGRLLDDLIHYVYSGENCRLLLIGDTAQLPPVGQETSPALQRDTLQGFGLNVFEATLKQIVRQAEDSGILYNATIIRKMLDNKTTNVFPQLKLSGFNDIKNITGEELTDLLTQAYDRDGIEQTIVISQSNKRATAFNVGIRGRILWKEEELSSGDILIIIKNNYYWSEKIGKIDFLANGELIVVKKILRTQELYGFRFCDALIKHPDYDIEMEIKLLLDTLSSDSSGLSPEKSALLYENIIQDYNDIATKAERMQKLKNDPFFNAVHVKYGYAITGHKAQGGEWKNVFVDFGYITKEHINTNFLRWMYTAITRSSFKLNLLNLPPQFFLEKY